MKKPQNQKIIIIKLIIIAITAGVTLWHNSAIAQFYPGGPTPFDREEILREFDTDGNGELSEEELRRMPQRGDDRFGPPFGGGMPRGPGGPGFAQENLVEKFDSDKDGKLNDDERKAVRQYIQSQSGGRGMGPGIGGPRGQRTQLRRIGQKNLVEMEKTFPYDTKADLYDEKVLRTLYLQFPNEDWYEEMADFYRTDVEVPATLTVDGKTYPSVGVRFRGNTSYMMASEKKPINISIDYADSKQRLYGYKTLNLLNNNTDPSFVREVLYSRICRDYLPAPRANFVRLVINGENWGIYANVQQFNNDFVQEWFGTKEGVRWKVPADPRGGIGALIWSGDNITNYRRAFELKTNESPEAWQSLIKLCQILKTTPDDKLEETLKPILNIDRTLWFIALDNVFIDNDGYISRGSDYCLFQDPGGRFHTIPYDNNETFRPAEGPGFGGRGDSGFSRSPVIHENNEMRPLISRLLSVPNLRARYLAHVRTIINEWLDWGKIEPVIQEYQNLIDAAVKADDKKPFSYEAFVASRVEDYKGSGEFGPPDRFGPPSDDGFVPPQGNFDNMGRGFRRGGPGGPGGTPGGGVPSFKRFVEERRAFLLNHPEIDKPVPSIELVSHQVAGKESNNSSPLETESVQVKTKIGPDVAVKSVILYYSKGKEMPFDSVNMKANGDNLYIGVIPPCPAGTLVHYYIEARAVDSIGTAAFAPAGAELKAFTYKVAGEKINQEKKDQTVKNQNTKQTTNKATKQITRQVVKGFPVVINEIMASNTKSLPNPRGEYNDWIELFNTSDKAVDLSGMYLSDDPDKPREWAFPENTVISPGGYLIIWADGNSKGQAGLHANFRLSAKGETLILVDSDKRGNAILDLVTFGEQKQDIAIGRLPDGTGDFKEVTMTPGKKNKP